MGHPGSLLVGKVEPEETFLEFLNAFTDVIQGRRSAFLHLEHVDTDVAKDRWFHPLEFEDSRLRRYRHNGLAKIFLHSIVSKHPQWSTT
jgi:hypothetical protein